MSDIEWVAVALAVTVLGIVTLGLAWFLFASRKGPAGSFARNRDGSFQMVCSMCAAPSEVKADALVRLSSAEKALVVREQPSAIGKDLVEFVCSSCDASHCFSATRDALDLIGVNLYQGQQFQVLCKECRRPLETPPWPKGSYDGKVDDAPGEIGAYGLTCGFCGASSCISCCRTATRNRTVDGTLLCPRCYRGPVDRFYHAEPAHAHRN